MVLVEINFENILPLYQFLFLTIVCIYCFLLWGIDEKLFKNIFF